MNVGLDTTTSPNNPPDFSKPPPSTGYPRPSDNALVINKLLDKLIEREGKNVVLVGHSSGGFAATYVARPKYQRKVRQEKNLAGGVIGIFYPKDGSPGVVPPYCQFHGNGFDSLASTVNGGQYFFNGLPEDQAKHYESILTASPVLINVLDNDAYAELPCAVLGGNADKRA